MRPFNFLNTDEIGLIITVSNVKADLSEIYQLPDKLRTVYTWRNVSGVRVLDWFILHDSGIIALPTIVGNGSQNYLQLVDWLERHNYEQVDEDEWKLRPKA